MVQNESRKHHYVPRSLLRYFSINGTGEGIYAFDKRSGRSFTTSLMDAGSENNFNKLETEAGVWNFEPLFDDVDGLLATRLKQLHSARDISALSLSDRNDWADLVAVQLVRTPIVRTTYTQFPLDLAASISDAGLDVPEADELPTDNDARRAAVQLFLDRAQCRRLLIDKDVVVFAPSGTGRFLVSDQPVVRQSTVPYGDAALSSPGIAIYLPLGPTLVLGMLCKSISDSVNKSPIEQTDLPSARKQSFIALREGLRTGSAVPWDDEHVSSFNHMQITESSRFLYGSTDDFDFARAVLEADPDSRDVKSNIWVGKMGSGLPPAQGMPPGTWLVLFGRYGHYMLPLDELRQHSWPLEATTREIAGLKHAIEDGPFSEMRIYQDRMQSRSIRQVRLEVEVNGNIATIKVRHSDASLEALEQAIQKSRVDKPERP